VTKTMDVLFEENKENMSDYNFMNIDIQGAELLALKGSKCLLEHMDYLYLEVNEEHLYKNCPLISDIDLFVKQFGFERVETSMTKWKWGDAFYIKKPQTMQQLYGKQPQFNNSDFDSN